MRRLPFVLVFVLVLVLVLVLENPGWCRAGRRWSDSPPNERPAAAQTRGMLENTFSRTSTAALNTSTSTKPTARRVLAKLKKLLDRGLLSRKLHRTSFFFLLSSFLFLSRRLHCTSFFVSFVTFCLKSDREATDAISPSGPDGR
jgi:hypothetical protein